MIRTTFPLALLFSFNTVLAFTIDKKDLACQKNEDCVVTNSSCSQYVAVAVAKKAEARYNTLLKAECSSYKGKMASMASGGPVNAVCEQNICILKSKTQP